MMTTMILQSPLVSWPPSTLTVNTNAVIDACEICEIAPETVQSTGLSEEQLCCIHLCALLVQGDTASARHLLLRRRQQSCLQSQPWVSLVQAMDQGNVSRVMSLLSDLEHGSNTLNLPLATYSAEMRQAYQTRWMQVFASTGIPEDLATSLQLDTYAPSFSVVSPAPEAWLAAFVECRRLQAVAEVLPSEDAARKATTTTAKSHRYNEIIHILDHYVLHGMEQISLSFISSGCLSSYPNP
jgi:hypothetical protein